MRAVVKTTLAVSCLLSGLALVIEPTFGQTAVLPVGQPVNFGAGALPTLTMNPVTDYQNPIVPVAGQNVGMILPAWLRFMIPPKTSNLNGPGVSVVPSPSQFPGARFPVFPTVTKTN
jgi:hypothetical protein